MAEALNPDAMSYGQADISYTVDGSDDQFAGVFESDIPTDAPQQDITQSENESKTDAAVIADSARQPETDAQFVEQTEQDPIEALREGLDHYIHGEDTDKNAVDVAADLTVDGYDAGQIADICWDVLEDYVGIENFTDEMSGLVSDMASVLTVDNEENNGQNPNGVISAFENSAEEHGISQDVWNEIEQGINLDDQEPIEQPAFEGATDDGSIAIGNGEGTDLYSGDPITTESTDGQINDVASDIENEIAIPDQAVEQSFIDGDDAEYPSDVDAGVEAGESFKDNDATSSEEQQQINMDMDTGNEPDVDMSQQQDINPSDQDAQPIDQSTMESLLDNVNFDNEDLNGQRNVEAAQENNAPDVSGSDDTGLPDLDADQPKDDTIDDDLDYPDEPDWDELSPYFG